MNPPVYLSLCDTFFLDQPGGMGRVAWDCAREFSRAGYESHMLCIATDDSLEGKTRTIDGVNVLTISRPQAHPLNPFRGERVIAAVERSVAQIAREACPSVVHAHSVFMGIAGLRAIGGRAPLLFTVHSPVACEQQVNWSQQGLLGRLKSFAGLPYLRSLERRVLRDAAVRHCLSRYTTQLLQKQHGNDYGATIIPHWTDDRWRRTRSKAEARRLAGLPADGPIFLSVRQLRYRYGLDTAIRAMGVANPDRGTFVLAGGGPDEAALRSLAARQPNAERILLKGRVSDDTLRMLYEAADAFILPTRALECFGLIILEAYGYGMPVLATDVAAIPELVGQVSPELLVPPDDVDAMASAMQSVATAAIPLPTPELLEAFAHGAYGRDSVFPRYLELLS